MINQSVQFTNFTKNNKHSRLTLWILEYSTAANKNPNLNCPKRNLLDANTEERCGAKSKETQRWGGVLMPVDASVQRSSSHATTTSTHLFKYTSSLPADGLYQITRPPTGPTGTRRYSADPVQRPHSPAAGSTATPTDAFREPFGNFRELFGSSSWKPNLTEPPSDVTIRRWWITTQRLRLQDAHWSSLALQYLILSPFLFWLRYFSVVLNYFKLVIVDCLSSLSLSLSLSLSFMVFFSFILTF